MNKYIVTGVLLVSTGFGLTACQKHKAPDQAARNNPPVATDQQASSQQPSKSNQLSAKVVPADYQLPACQGKDCPEIEIKRLQTSNPWITRFVDEQILQLSNVQLSEELAKVTTLQANIDRFLNAAKQDSIQRGAPVPYSMQFEPEFLGQKAHVVMVKISAAYYTGGAHGSALDNYYNLDLTQHKQLKLDDILVANQKQKLYDLVHQQYVDWAQKNGLADDMTEYEKSWPFKLTDNFTFDKDGLKLSYGQYEIGPYAVGMPEFTVPYAQLSGIVKPEYL